MAERRPLTRARILRAALALVDREGLDALSMRRIAARLDVEAMSLYHHVPNKDAVLAGVFDLVIAKAELPSGDVTAAQWIRGAGTAFRRLAHQHPRAFPLLTSRPIPLADAAAATPMESGLAAFARAGMAPAEAFAALQAVSLSLLSLALVESRVALGADEDDASQLADLPAERFPLLSAAPDLDVGPDLVWEALVEALVRGLTGTR